MRIFIFLLYLFFAQANAYSLNFFPLSEEDLLHFVDVAEGRWIENSLDLEAGDVKLHRSFLDTPRTLKNCAYGWQFNFPIFSEDTPVCVLAHRELLYERDESGRVVSIVCRTDPDRVSTGAIRISYAEKPALHCKIQSEEGRFVSYWFEPFCKDIHLLSKVEKPGEPTVTYKYQPHPVERKPLLVERSSDGGETLYFTYWESGKIKSIGQKRTSDSPIETVCELEYGSNFTIATLSLGVIRYTFDSNHFITSTTLYTQGGSCDTPYREMHFSWEDKKIIKKTVLDSSKNILVQESFSYDKSGRLLRDTLEGNLTGSGKDVYTRSYQYDAVGRLTSSSDDCGTMTTWHYSGDNPQPIVRCILQKGQPLQKTEYLYNDNGWMVEERICDPNQEGSKRVLVTRHLHFGPTGTPLETVTGYKAEDQSFIQEKRTRIILDRDGRLISNEVFDQNDLLIDCNTYCYDSQGKIVEEKNLNQNKIYLYNEFGKLCETIETSDGQKTHQLLDGLKRVVWQQIESPGELPRTLTYEYDPSGRITATCNHLGQRLVSSYDALGRKISEQLAPLFTQEGEWMTPIVNYNYDTLDRIVEILDPSGFATKTQYNVRGQPIHVLHPDGTEETFRYSLDGKLELTRIREGLLLNGSRDPFDRVQFEETFDRKGERIRFKQYAYDAFDLIGENDSEGSFSCYEYDLKGRMIRSSTESCTTDLLYDLAGKLYFKRRNFESASYETYLNSETKTWNLRDAAGKVHLERREEAKPNDDSSRESLCIGPSDTLVVKNEMTNALGVTTITLSDAVGRLLQIEKRSPLNELLFKQEIFYAPCGKVSLERTFRIYRGKILDFIDNSFSYGPCGRIETAIEKWGKCDSEITNYLYGDYGALQTIQKPDGVRIHYEYDDSGLLKRLFSSDQTIDYGFTYDSKGNPCVIANHLTGNATLRKYDPRGQLIEEKLENGLHISFEYDDQGRRCKTLLPDTSYIDYEFDSLFLRKVNKCSKEGTCLYSHTYLDFDLSGKPTLEKGLSNSGSLIKQYNDRGELFSISYAQFSQENTTSRNAILTHSAYGIIEEKYSKDLLGQIVTVEGQNNEEYGFDSFGTDQGAQSTCEYDLNGNLIAKNMKGELYTYSYDALNRLMTVNLEGAPLLRMEYDALHRRISLHTKEESQLFLYDGNMEIGSFDQDHVPKELRVLGLSEGSETHSTVAIELEGIPYAPLHDLQGSICGLVSEEGELKSLKHFQPFGHSSTLLSSLNCPWGYFAKREDSASGLINFGRRFYNPSCRSWISKDPIGFADGPNRRLFVKNDPLHFKDHFGLSSTPQDSYSIKEHLKQLLRQAGVRILHTMRKLRDYVTINKEQMLNHVIGFGALHFLGLRTTTEESGVYGHGEVSDKVRVSFINGILTDYTSLYSNLQALSESHGHVNIHYVYRPTKGWVWDILHSFLVKLGYVSKEAKQLASDWKLMIAEMGGVDGGGKIIHYAHSIGAVESLRALSLLTPEEQKLISMYAFGSPNISSGAGLAEIYHFVSVRDGVSLLDPLGFIRACRGGMENVLFVGSFFGLPLVDHLFTAQTYQDLWRSMGRTFIEWYGTMT